MFSQMSAVGIRVLRQLIRDRRFLILTMVVPVVIIYMLFLFFDAINNPLFRKNEFVPPMGAFIVHFLTYVLSAIVLVRERTQHTMTRMFVSGYRRASIIGGYVFAYSVIATIQSLIVLVMLTQLFDLAYTGIEMGLMFLVMWMLAVISIALGILVSNFARNEGQVLPMIPLLIMPSILFSGMIVKTSLMPDWTRIFSLATPMYYANEAIQAIGDSFDATLFLSLLAYGVIVMLLAVFTLREQV